MRFPRTRSILICMALFLAFVVLRFPYQNLRGYLFGKIYAASGIYITAEDLSPIFLGWPGLRLYRVEVVTPPQSGSMSISAEQLTARVSLSGLFPPVPLVSMYFQGLKGGGDLYVRGGQGGNYTRASIQAKRVALKQFTIPGMAGVLQGEFNADGNIEIAHDDFSKTNGTFDLETKGFQLPTQTPVPGITIAAMNMGNLRGRIQIRNGTAEFNNLQFGDANSDAKGTATGDLKLGRTIESSFLSLTLNIQLSEKFRQNPQAATTVSFLKTFQTNTTGEYAMKWNASFEQMRTNIYTALPQAVR